jgi:hypothetical protein
MKISRPPSPNQAGPLAKTPGVGGAKGHGFATKLQSAERTAAPAGARRSADGPAAVRRSCTVSDIGAEIKAGRITPEAAIDKVVERVLDRQLGKKAGAALREKVGAALRDSLADDPLLMAKVRTLSGE